jgi:hypothetical protein
MNLIAMKTNCMNNTPNFMTKLRQNLLIAFLSFLLFPSVAFAYVDPGSGSVIVSTVLGLIAAIGYTFRKYFYKLKRKIRGKKAEEEDQDSK